MWTDTHSHLLLLHDSKNFVLLPSISTCYTWHRTRSQYIFVEINEWMNECMQGWVKSWNKIKIMAKHPHSPQSSWSYKVILLSYFLLSPKLLQNNSLNTFICHSLILNFLQSVLCPYIRFLLRLLFKGYRFLENRFSCSLLGPHFPVHFCIT